MLKDKVIVITGGAGLLGKEFCRAVAESNGTVIVADKDPEQGERAAEKINAAYPGNRAHFHRVDINDRRSLDSLIATVSRHHDGIDALVNNAYPRNGSYGRKFEDVTREDFCENLALHVGGYFLAAQSFIEHFRKRGRGNIVNLASVYGYLAPRFDIYKDTAMTMPVEYAVIKAGILQLTRYLAVYLKNENIRVNALSPGGILDSQPQSFLAAYREFCANKGMLNGRDVSGALLFLLSDMSAYVNGHNLVVDDGFSL